MTLPIWLLFLYRQLILWHAGKAEDICSEAFTVCHDTREEMVKDEVCSRGTSQACLCGNIKGIICLSTEEIIPG